MRENQRYEMYVELYKAQKCEIKKHLEEGERIHHCRYKACYRPQYVITNKGRVWGLSKCDWMKVMWNGHYWFVGNGEEKVYVHELVSCYFPSKSDKLIRKDYEKGEYEIHHKKRYAIADEIGKMSAADRMKMCMLVNNAENLCVQLKVDHHMITTWERGKKTKEQKDDLVEMSFELSMMLDSLAYDENSSIWIEYEKNENDELNNLLNVKTKI